MVVEMAEVGSEAMETEVVRKEAVRTEEGRTEVAVMGVEGKVAAAMGVEGKVAEEKQAGRMVALGAWVVARRGCSQSHTRRPTTRRPTNTCCPCA